jgi:hypothetical protein
MILEAFSEVLHQYYHHSERSATAVLQQWLHYHLSHPCPQPCNHIHRVLLTEIQYIEGSSSLMVFSGRSPSGDKLLASVYDYCQSYENWQYRRWLHTVQPKDFAPLTT